ncbi:MAG: hypothetical protein V3T89_02945, partial [bacterium]
MKEKCKWFVLLMALFFLGSLAFLQAEEKEMRPEVKTAIEKLNSENPAERSEAALTLGRLRD